ncbi:Metalloenzyme, LuxS/M16 peptidase-like protein [Schizophyllum commune]
MTVEQPDWRRVAARDGVPAYNMFTRPIVRSQQDDREYRVIKLDNGVEAMLVHDAKADKAAASLDVAVGHLYDPDDMPGLAHFCEHLLFMGTETYPKENEYSEYLAKNNGHSNAYTSTLNTNYYFNVGTHALPGALARFSAFFHCPLFAPSCTTRELNAVDSEHKKNHQADLWRIFQLNKHLTKPGHPWKKFGSGNKDSLSRAAKELKAQGKLAETTPSPSVNGSLAPTPASSRLGSPTPSSTSEVEADGGAVGRETRRRVVEWWQKEYCASRMRVCVLGKESLDELSDLVSTNFSPIPNRGRDPLPTIPDHPFGSDEKGTLVSVKTIMSFHALEISFPLEDQADLWRYKPANFLSHFLGHEGPGSLYSYLKNKGWATSLGSGPQNLARGFAMFKVTVYLTSEGFLNYQEVISSTFKYISLLRSSTFEPYHQEEQSQMSEIRFRFAEKRQPDSYATWIAETMARPLPRDQLLSAPSLVQPWQGDEPGTEKTIRKYLDSFTMDNCRVVLMAQGEEHAKLVPEATWEKEPWYGTEYRVERFKEEQVKEATAANDIKDLFLPGRNEFIPTNLDVQKKAVAEPAKRPFLIRQSKLSELWHKKDDQFWVPKAQVIIDIRSPASNASPATAVATRLFADLVNDSLSEFSYDADLAGLSYNLTSYTTGLYVLVSGYNDKVAILLEHIMDRIKNLEVKADRLAIMKEQAKRDWENTLLGQSYSLSDYFGRYALTEKLWTFQEKLAVVPSITVEDIQRQAQDILSSVYMRMLVAGNVYKDEAIRMAEIAEEGLGATELKSTELDDQALALPENCNYGWFMDVPNPNQANSALTYYVQFGPITDESLRVTSSLLVQIMREPSFNVLRTQEQLGYIVHCSAWLLPGGTLKGVRIVVQSEKPPSYLEERVEAFLVGMQKTIEEMTPEVFEEQKDGLKRKWLEADKNLAEETARYNTHITTGQYDFLRYERNAELLDNVTKDQVMSLFMERVHPSSTIRSKLSVHARSKKPKPQPISLAAAEAFENVVRGADLGVDASAWRDAVGGEDTISLHDFGKHWVGVLGQKEGGKALLAKIPELMKAHPAEVPSEERKLDQVKFIDDLKAFKSTLQVAPNPGPMVQWGDLPTANL